MTPRIVVLCGSSRFRTSFEAAELAETLAGHIVLSLATYSQSDGIALTSADVARLAEIHRHKIELADEVLVIDIDEYIGEATRAEITFAQDLGKPVRFRSRESRQ